MQLNTLLVALMFVTILCMGIGNIMMVLADVFNTATPSRRDRVHLAWIALVLLIHFNLFWHTKAILASDDWHFAGFMGTVAGPVLLLFSTSILLTNPPDHEPARLKTFFDDLGRRFYVMFAVVQVWILLASRSLLGSFNAADLVNVAYIVLALILAAKPRRSFQVPGAWIAWGLGLGALVLGGVQ